jgi:hypothetical protein
MCKHQDLNLMGRVPLDCPSIDKPIHMWHENCHELLLHITNLAYLLFNRAKNYSRRLRLFK